MYHFVLLLADKSNVHREKEIEFDSDLFSYICSCESLIFYLFIILIIILEKEMKKKCLCCLSRISTQLKCALLFENFVVVVVIVNVCVFQSLKNRFHISRHIRAIYSFIFFVVISRLRMTKFSYFSFFSFSFFTI